jgi:hypothetical protein
VAHVSSRSTRFSRASMLRTLGVRFNGIGTPERTSHTSRAKLPGAPGPITMGGRTTVTSMPVRTPTSRTACSPASLERLYASCGAGGSQGLRARPADVCLPRTPIVLTRMNRRTPARAACSARRRLPR